MLGIFSIFFGKCEKGPKLTQWTHTEKGERAKKREFLFREHLRKFKLLLENLKLSR